MYRNVGIYKSDAGELPKRKHTRTVDKFVTARARGMFLVFTRFTKTLLPSISWLHDVRYKHTEPHLTQCSCIYFNFYHRPLGKFLVLPSQGYISVWLRIALPQTRFYMQNYPQTVCMNLMAIPEYPVGLRLVW